MSERVSEFESSSTKMQEQTENERTRALRSSFVFVGSAFPDKGKTMLPSNGGRELERRQKAREKRFS